MSGTQFSSADGLSLPNSAGSPVDIVVVLGYRPGFVKVWTNLGGTNPDSYESFDSAIRADKVLKTTGSSGVVTVVTNANGITFQENGFTLKAAAQTASGLNSAIAYRA